jgi:LacI family transcriptional regulator
MIRHDNSVPPPASDSRGTASEAALRRQRPNAPPHPMIALLLDAVSGYGSSILRGVTRYANLHRRWVILKHLRPTMNQPMRKWPKCDGAILGGSADEHLPSALRNTRHIVRCSGGANPSDTPVVCMNDFEVGVLAAKHLLDCRLTNFGFVGLTAYGTSSHRFEGFSQTIREAGFQCEDAQVGWPAGDTILFHEHWGTLNRWLAKLPKPAGVMTVDDSVADDVAAACLAAGIAVPDDVAIVGVNNDPLLCECAWPPLSSVDCDYSRVGYLAAQLLDRMINGEKLSSAERLTRLAPLGVIKRQSTDLLAVQDPWIAQAIRFIRAHACEPCSVQDVLDHVPVNRRWLERQFLDQLGRTPYDEIVRVRIERARTLLLDPKMKLSDIGECCGYMGFSNFRTAFKKLVKQSPAEYRRAALCGRK